MFLRTFPTIVLGQRWLYVTSNTGAVYPTALAETAYFCCLLYAIRYGLGTARYVPDKISIRLLVSVCSVETSKAMPCQADGCCRFAVAEGRGELFRLGHGWSWR